MVHVDVVVVIVGKPWCGVSTVNKIAAVDDATGHISVMGSREIVNNDGEVNLRRV